MDMDRLSLDEIRLVGKIIEVIGIPAMPDELEAVIRSLDALATGYRRTLAGIREANARHGEL